LNDRAQNKFIVGTSTENYAGWEDVSCTLTAGTLYYM
jgi:hypothetical protein